MASGSDSDRQEDPVLEEDVHSASDNLGSDPEKEVHSGSEDSGSECGLDNEEDSKSHRGPTVKAKANKRTVVTYNKRGVPYGPGAKKLATFEGLVARSMVPITYDSWLNVDKQIKEACWQYVRTRFSLHSKSRHQVVKSIGVKWKNFKHYLYKKFIKPMKDDKSKEAKKQLYTPPARYPSVKRKDWALFISQKTKPSFEEKSQWASSIRSRNKYNHRLSRKGYAGLIAEIMEETGKEEEDIDRVECWKKAREKKPKQGGGYDPAVESVIKKIDKLKEENDYDDFPMGASDLLTEALGTEEQRGRVRGMGKFVTPQQYFMIPKNVKQYLKQHDQRMIKRLRRVEDELATIKRCTSTYASEGASNCQVLSSDEEEEANVPDETIDKSCYLAAEVPSNIVAKGTIVDQTVSDGNIQVKVDTSVEAEAQIPIPLPEEFVETVKDAIGYILSWPTDLVIPCSSLNKIVAKKKKKKTVAQDMEKRRKEERKEEGKSKEQERIEEEAAGKSKEEGKEEGKEEDGERTGLGSETHKKKERKKRPREPDDKEKKVGKKPQTVEKGESSETIASTIAKLTRKKKGTPVKKMMTRGQRQGRKRMEERTGLKMTALMVDGQVAKVDGIKVQCEDDLFGHASFTWLTWNDFERLFTMDELTGAVVTSYIMYLYEQIRNGSQIDHGICFMTPSAIMSAEVKAKAKNIEDASRSIFQRLCTRDQRDLVLVPYNPGNHWTLGAINMKTSTCYYLDSLSIGTVHSEFKQIVNTAIALYDAEVGTNKRTKLKWEIAKVPTQPGSTECGYFMLKFMKEIVEHGAQILENDNIGGDTKEYMDDELDDLREEWCLYVSSFIFR